MIPVAILTTTEFDATTVDGTTVRFGPSGASPEHDQSHSARVASHQHDVDGDRDVDYLLHFRMQDAGIPPGDAEACITGQTLTGQPFEGCDSIKIVPRGRGTSLLALLWLVPVSVLATGAVVGVRVRGHRR